MSPQRSALPFWVPARFLLIGLAALAAAFTALAVHPEWLLGWRATPAMLAVVHTITLLFVTMTFAGAAQQLAPVLLETPLRSVSLARASFPLLFAGSLGVVGGFALGFRVPWLAAGGVLALSALMVVAVNLALTARDARRRDAVDLSLLASFGYLLLALALGTLLALARVVPGLAGVANELPLHLGLGLFGAFFLGIAAAGHKLLSMFLLSHGVGTARLRALAVLVHAAMVLLLLGAVFELPLDGVAALLLGVAVALFLIDTLLHVRARRRRTLEPAVRHYIAACGFLVVAIAAAATGQWTAAVASVVAGFLPLLVAGMSVKIIAFLAWQHRFAPHVGARPVPLLRDLPLPALEPVALAGLVAGGTGVVAAYLVQPDAWILRVALLGGAAGAWACLAQSLWIVFAEHAPKNATAPGTATAPRGGTTTNDAAATSTRRPPPPLAKEAP